MSKLEKFQTLIVLSAGLLGLLLGQVSFIEQNAAGLVTPFLFVMLYGVFLHIPLKGFRKAFTNVRFSALAVLTNFIWTPLLVWGLGAVFLSEHPVLWIGFVMLMVTPCTDWYLVFTGIAKGNVPLSTSLLPINLVLQIVLLPVYLLLFAGVSGTVEIGSLLSGIFVMLILPFTLAQLTIGLFRRVKVVQKFQERYYGFFASTQTVFLALAVAAMFASQGRTLLANAGTVYLLLPPMLLFYTINFLLAQLNGRLLRFSYEDTASLTFTTVSKNSPMTLGIAILAFPNEPIIALVMVIEPLVELPVVFLLSQILLRIRARRQKQERLSEAVSA